MARPEEKANAMLNKFVKMREAGNAPAFERKRRPKLASDCDSLKEAEGFRRELVREITTLITKIQNPGLGEHVIRDVNDDINRKMREKHHWNKRIHQHLGGQDYSAIERKQQLNNATDDPTQAIIVGSGGYRYYGAAKELPGVRQLFEQQALLKQKKRNRAHIYKRITPDYYGWRDEEDGVLLELEQQHQQKKKTKQSKATEEDEAPAIYICDNNVQPVSQEAIAAALLERKKQELLSRFS